MTVSRKDFLCTALELMGTPYIWGGKDPVRGLDCSGLVTHALWLCGGPDWRWSHNSELLYDSLKETKEPQPGDLAFYGKGRISHVMIALGALDIVFGASDGDSSTTSAKEAKRRDAEVETRPSHLYRSDFWGWRAMPLED